MTGKRGLGRLIVLILVLGIAEVAWAMWCAVTGLNLVLFYVGLLAGTAVFFIPGLAGNPGG